MSKVERGRYRGREGEGESTVEPLYLTGMNLAILSTKDSILITRGQFTAVLGQRPDYAIHSLAGVFRLHSGFTLDSMETLDSMDTLE